MQLSIETTTQSASIFTATTSGSRSAPASALTDKGKDQASPVLSSLQSAAKKAEEDAVVIAALQEAVEKGKGETDKDSEKSALAKMDEYRETAGKLKTALGEETGPGRASVSYESATISTTTIEAEIGGETVSAEFISIERVSFDNETGLSVRRASASNIDAELGNLSASYQSASVSSLYAGTGEQLGNLLQSRA